MKQPNPVTLDEVRAMLTSEVGSRYPSKGGMVVNRLRAGASDAILTSTAATGGAGAVQWRSAGSNGQMLRVNTGEADSLEFLYADNMNPNARAAGSTLHACTFNPLTVMTGAAIGDAQILWLATYLPYDATITGATYEITTNGNYTADQENSIALYTSDGTTLTRVATTGNVATLWSAGAALQTAAFTSPYAASAGMYWISVLSNWSAVVTAPQLARIAVRPNILNARLPGNVTFCAYRTAVTAAPSTQAWSGMTGVTANMIWLGLY